MVERRQLGEGVRGLLGGLLSPVLDDPRAFYEAGYTQPDAAEAERLGRWRALGARSKGAHVIALCARAGVKPATVVVSSIPSTVANRSATYPASVLATPGVIGKF